MIGALERSSQKPRAHRSALRRSLITSLLFLCGTLAAEAEEQVFADAGCALNDGGTGVVAAILDPVSLRLDSGIVVRLAGILPFDGTDEMAAEAVAFLEQLTLGKTITIGLGSIATDRYERTVAQLFLAELAETWVQAELVGAGLAIVGGSAEDRTCLGDLLAYERNARASDLGVWAARHVFTAETAGLNSDLPRFELVQGQVVSIGRTERTVYLNFGYDWSTDFTVTIEAATATAIELEGGPLDRLIGRDIRICGWLQWWNGPWIEVDHPEQIEVLDGDNGGV